MLSTHTTSKEPFSRLYKELPDKNNVEVDNLIGKKDKKPEKVLHICTQWEQTSITYGIFEKLSNLISS